MAKYEIFNPATLLPRFVRAVLARIDATAAKFFADVREALDFGLWELLTFGVSITRATLEIADAWAEATQDINLAVPRALADVMNDIQLELGRVLLPDLAQRVIRADQAYIEMSEALLRVAVEIMDADVEQVFTIVKDAAKLDELRKLLDKFEDMDDIDDGLKDARKAARGTIISRILTIVISLCQQCMACGVAIGAAYLIWHASNRPFVPMLRQRNKPPLPVEPTS